MHLMFCACPDNNISHLILVSNTTYKIKMYWHCGQVHLSSILVGLFSVSYLYAHCDCILVAWEPVPDGLPNVKKHTRSTRSTSLRDGEVCSQTGIPSAYSIIDLQHLQLYKIMRKYLSFTEKIMHTIYFKFVLTAATFLQI